MRAIMVDVETGGLDPKVHALTSVAAIAFEVDAQGAFKAGRDNAIDAWNKREPNQ